jgi:pimeloyl-ACP methyl ester carboxylesterase
VNFSFYEQRDPSGAFGSSIAEFFALRHYDVYGLGPRFEAIPAGTCEAGLFDCSVMAGWNLQSMVDDIAFVRSQIELLHPGTEIVAGGASLGGILALATADAHPDDYDGILVWEGMLASPDPVVQALNQGYCDALEAAIAGGAVSDGVGANVFKAVSKQAELAPSGLNLIPLFPPTLTAHQVLVLLLSVTAPGPVTMPVPGYVQMAGSFPDDELFFASEPRVFEDVGRFNSYVPNPVVRDVSCSLAGEETAYVDNLGAFTGSVLALGGGRGFGPFMQDNLDLLGSTDVTFLLEPDFGHIDHFMTAQHRQFVERPILDWLREVFGQP